MTRQLDVNACRRQFPGLARLVNGRPVVFLDGPADLISTRMRRRAGHYMPSSLLESQLLTLERPRDDETDVVHLSIVDEPSTMAVEALCALHQPVTNPARRPI